MVDGVHVKGDVRASLEMGGYSSVSIEGSTEGGVRICSKPSPAWGEGGIAMRPLMKKWKVGAITTYKVGRSNIHEFITRRRSGVPIYPGSFDLYCFLVGLCCDNRFASAITGLRSSWYSLWLMDGDLDTLRQRIDEWRTTFRERVYPSHMEIVNMLSGLWLRCDAMDVMWKGLKS